MGDLPSARAELCKTHSHQDWYPAFNNCTEIIYCIISVPWYKAIHLDLTSQAFISALQRYTIAQSQIIDFCSRKHIKLSFIPARSPHFGGLWEAGIKSVKTQHKKVAHNTHRTLEEMNTLLIQNESVLNSRLLTSISSDSLDLEALTPEHFLIGQPLISIPEPSLLDT